MKEAESFESQDRYDERIPFEGKAILEAHGEYGEMTREMGICETTRKVMIREGRQGYEKDMML